MSLLDVGRLAVKIAGRDAGRKCVVVEQIDNNFVLVDGNVRRKKVNVKHLEPLDKTVELKSGASHSDVKSAFEKLGFAVWDKKSKKPAERPRKQKKKKEAPVEKKEKKVAKKEEKVEVKETPVEEAPKEDKPVEEVKSEVPKGEEGK